MNRYNAKRVSQTAAFIIIILAVISGCSSTRYRCFVLEDHESVKVDGWTFETEFEGTLDQLEWSWPPARDNLMYDFRAVRPRVETGTQIPDIFIDSITVKFPETGESYILIVSNFRFFGNWASNTYIEKAFYFESPMFENSEFMVPDSITTMVLEFDAILINGQFSDEDYFDTIYPIYNIGQTLIIKHVKMLFVRKDERRWHGPWWM
jgi:hypothetical protein